mgnify:CR=1 FL=1
MNLDTITPLILTYNEEANIGRTLEKLTWAERIVVVDSYSTDATLNILEEYPQVEIFQREFDSHTVQWNFGLQQVDTEWALSLDADYILSDALVDEIRTLALTPSVDGYHVSFIYCIFGTPLRASLYPSRLVLFRKEKGIYVQDGHTQRLELGGSSETLANPIYHDDRKPLGRWLQAQEQYARREAEKLENASSLSHSLPDRLRRYCLAPILTPLYCLFGKRLILDGRAGLYYTLQRTYAELLLALYLLDERLRGELSRKTSNS